MRLERHDPYLTTFRATVEERRLDAAGTWLRLDKSAFYPTSGGQPHDTGSLTWRLGGVSTAARVSDVQLASGAVWHLCQAADGELPEVGSVVSGSIDWDRRFTHMQRHTGQHLLSQAFVRVGSDLGRVFGTRSVSLRGPDCTLDLSDEPGAAELAAVEAEANAVARRALPVVAFEVDESRLGSYRLRRPAKVSGLVRLVAIGDYDIVACGGTHVRSSAELLPLKLLGRERVKGGLTRVTFRVGAEALDDLAAKHLVSARLTELLSTPVTGLAERVESLLTQLSQTQQEASAARAELAADLAERLLGDADTEALAGLRLVSGVLAEPRSALLEPLVTILQGTPSTISLLASQEPGGGVRFAFLCGPDVDRDVRPALSAALALVEGRGGGRPDRAQGAGPPGSDAIAALAAARERLLA